MDQIRGIIQQYVGGGSGDNSGDDANVQQDFNQVAQSAPQGDLANGIASAFRSDQTPPFGQMVGQMFGQGNGDQKAGLLNQLISSVGPGLLGSVMGGGGLSALSGLLGGGQGQVTPEQANQVPADEVQQVATHAANQDPSIIDTISQYAAGNPGMVQGIGGSALKMIMSKLGV